MDQNELRKMMAVKVGDLGAIIELKSNKTDTDLIMKCVDIMHKQITHVIVLVVELIKLDMVQMSLQTDSDKSKHQKNLMYILQQGINVCRWLNEFDP